jgi:hypothetical protein
LGITAGNERVNLTFPASLYQSLERLSAKCGLDVPKTIKYCVARVAEKELRTPKEASRAEDIKRLCAGTWTPLA